jgi:hypothetical protein
MANTDEFLRDKLRAERAEHEQFERVLETPLEHEVEELLQRHEAKRVAHARYLDSLLREQAELQTV